jgi:hypothetical protein
VTAFGVIAEILVVERPDQTDERIQLAERNEILGRLLR